MNVADDLRAAAEYIREHGHAKGVAAAGDGSVCALGGIARSTGVDVGICYGMTDGVTPDQYDRFLRALGVLRDYLSGIGVLGDKYRLLSRWSDASQADDVITSMEKAAAWIEEQA